MTLKIPGKRAPCHELRLDTAFAVTAIALSRFLLCRGHAIGVAPNLDSMGHVRQSQQQNNGKQYAFSLVYVVPASLPAGIATWRQQHTYLNPKLQLSENGSSQKGLGKNGLTTTRVHEVTLAQRSLRGVLQLHYLYNRDYQRGRGRESSDANCIRREIA